MMNPKDFEVIPTVISPPAAPRAKRSRTSASEAGGEHETLRAIGSGGGGAATIKDVARVSGVSVGTVSNVLNGRHSLVRADTRDRVLNAARTLNFQPNAAARSLVQGRTRTLGILFHTGTGVIVVDPYASTVLQGILRAAAECGYGILLYPEPWHDAAQGARLFADRRVDGVVAIAPRFEDVPDIAGLGLPLALVSVRYEPGDERALTGAAILASADVDNIAGGHLAAGHLLGLGHRRIAHLAGDTFQRSAHDREAGFRQALDDAGVPLLPEYFVQCDYSGGTGYEATRRLLALPEPPTAIFAANDHLAFACLRAAHDADVRVPEQFSVIGFDDVPTASLVTPALTTIRQPLVRIGASAVARLVARLEDRASAGGSAADGASSSADSAPSQESENSLVFAPELVVRSTTARPPPSPPPRRSSASSTSKSLSGPPRRSVTEGVRK